MFYKLREIRDPRLTLILQTESPLIPINLFHLLWGLGLFMYAFTENNCSPKDMNWRKFEHGNNARK